MARRPTRPRTGPAASPRQRKAPGEGQAFQLSLDLGEEFVRPRWGELKPHDEFIDRKNRCWLVRSIAPAKTEGMVIVVAECAETGETRTLFGRVGNEVGVLW